MAPKRQLSTKNKWDWSGTKKLKMENAEDMCTKTIISSEDIDLTNMTQKCSQKRSSRTVSSVGLTSKKKKMSTDKSSLQESECIHFQEKRECNYLNNVSDVTCSKMEDKERKIRTFMKLGNVDSTLAQTLINLFSDDATIPFLARYRRHLTQNKTAEELRSLKDTYENVNIIIRKSNSIVKSLAKIGKLTEPLEAALKAATSIDELEFLQEPYKDKKANKLEAAKALGLEGIANDILFGSTRTNVHDIINSRISEGISYKEIHSALILTVSNLILSNPLLLEEIRSLKITEKILLCCTKLSKKDNKNDSSTFENYFNFTCEWSKVKPHQVLAVNRGVSKKVLTSEIKLPQSFMDKLCTRARQIYLSNGYQYHERLQVFSESFSYAYKHKISPLVKRTVRADMNKIAEKASIDVFASNLKCLLLSPPVRGVTVLAIDPGFSHGCKIAVVSPSGNVLYTGKLNLTCSPVAPVTEIQFKELLINNRVNVIAIGNGKGCRQVEEFISFICNLKELESFDLTYMIVSEQGISYYSCSKDAAEEFPELDPNLISAVSLARRVQDPMCELVKVEPRHLGVGMYQHDVNKKKLEDTLSEVVSECVSCVGVDINTASKKLLRHVAGLNNKTADKIISYRTENGPFRNREQLKTVKGIGPKTFQQCGGFVKILPKSVDQCRSMNNPKNEFQPLDQTDIHPELYDAANRVLKMCCLQIKDLGNSNFISAVRSWTLNKDLLKEANELKISTENLKIILDAFTCNLDTDQRLILSQPIFHKKLKTISNLQFGHVLSGRVSNVTHFGAFVDIGLERDGLIPSRYINGFDVKLGQSIQIKVIDINRETMKVTLGMLGVLG